MHTSTEIHAKIHSEQKRNEMTYNIILGNIDISSCIALYIIGNNSKNKNSGLISINLETKHIFILPLFLSKATIIK